MMAALPAGDAARIVVTGCGLMSAAGASMAELAASLAARRHCLTPITAFDAAGLAATHCGEAAGFEPLALFSPAQLATIDRGTQLALAASRQAWSQAGLGEAAIVGVAIGVSGSPQFQNMRVAPGLGYPSTRQGALVGARSTPMFQADLIARQLRLSGPRFAFGAASLGGVLALAHAMDLLRAGHACAMLVGGGEIHTLMNALGMDLLGMAGAGPCTPFAGESGMCFGEGAAAFVLETAAAAERRGAVVLAELVAAGISADAYSDMGQDPAGKGLSRAVGKCLAGAGTEPAQVGWVRSCGTGQRELDAAEAIGLQSAFAGAAPPVTSTEPYFSHVNGVSPLLGLAAVIVGLATGEAPCAPDAVRLRTGITLTALPAGKLPAGDCLLTATAFGGNNGAILVRRGGSAGPVPQSATIDIVIAGLGAVSPLGGSVAALLEGLAADDIMPAAAARRVEDRWLRDDLPGLRLRRRDRLMRMSLQATAEALRDAGLDPRGSQRVGLLVGLTRGPMAAYERFFERTQAGIFDITAGRHLLRTGRFSVASEIAHAFGLLGYSGAMACGVHGGVQLLAHGAEVLRASADLESLLVVAADEWTPLLEKIYRRLGLLGHGQAYADAAGCIGGEGAAAVLLSRTPPGAGTGAGWASITGTGFAGDTGTLPDSQGVAYGGAVAGAIGRAGCGPADIDFAIGQGCGWPAHDAREVSALARACPAVPVTSLLPRLGVAEGAGGLFGAMAGAAALRNPARANLVRGRRPSGEMRHGIVVGSSERGAHAALVLSRLAA